MTFDHRKYQDLQRVAESLREMPFNGQRQALSVIMTKGLMNTHWWVKACVWIISKRHGSNKKVAWHLLLGNHDVLDNTRKEFCKHLLHGKDMFDPQSAGGFCEDDLDDIVGVLVIAGARLPFPLEYEQTDAA